MKKWKSFIVLLNNWKKILYFNKNNLEEDVIESQLNLNDQSWFIEILERKEYWFIKWKIFFENYKKVFEEDGKILIFEEK